MMEVPPELEGRHEHDDDSEPDPFDDFVEESDDEDAKTNDDDSDSGDSFMSLDDDDLDHIDAMREQVRHAPVGGR